MTKLIPIKENNIIRSRRVNSHVSLRETSLRKIQNAWITKKDTSASSYFVKANYSHEWYTGSKNYIAVSKSENQPYLEIQVGGKTHLLYNELHLIADQINDAKELLTYKTDWDSDGSLATNEVVFNNAINFLVLYSNYIYQNYSNTIIHTPYIDITREGGISIFWETNKAKFFIIFKNSNAKTAFFFAEKIDVKIPFKSAIEIGGPVDESIAFWIKVNLG